MKAIHYCPMTMLTELAALSLGLCQDLKVAKLSFHEAAYGSYYRNLQTYINRSVQNFS